MTTAAAKSWQSKDRNYRNQSGKFLDSPLTPAQRRRIRKTRNRALKARRS